MLALAAPPTPSVRWSPDGRLLVDDQWATSPSGALRAWVDAGQLHWGAPGPGTGGYAWGEPGRVCVGDPDGRRPCRRARPAIRLNQMLPF